MSGLREMGKLRQNANPCIFPLAARGHPGIVIC
jgi:hypothetical protein